MASADAVLLVVVDDVLVFGLGVGFGFVLLATGALFTFCIGRGCTTVPSAVPSVSAPGAGPGFAPAISPVPGLVVPGTSSEAACCRLLLLLLLVLVGGMADSGVSLVTGGVVSAPVVGFVLVPLAIAPFSVAVPALVAAEEVPAETPAIPEVVPASALPWLAAFSLAAVPVVLALGLVQ